MMATHVVCPLSFWTHLACRQRNYRRLSVSLSLSVRLVAESGRSFSSLHTVGAEAVVCVGSVAPLIGRRCDRSDDVPPRRQNQNDQLLFRMFSEIPAVVH